MASVLTSRNFGNKMRGTSLDLSDLILNHINGKVLVLG